jgi:hypothetical protein
VGEGHVGPPRLLRMVRQARDRRGAAGETASGRTGWPPAGEPERQPVRDKPDAPAE